MFDQLIVFGSGLIGASVAKAAKTRQVVDQVVVVNRSADTNRIALDTCVCDEAFTYEGLAKATTLISENAIVLIAVPVQSYEKIFKIIRKLVPKGALITDAGSTKVSIVAAARSVLEGHLPYFVPSHPIAGSEKSGVLAANENLFASRRTIITPIEGNTEDIITRLSAFWQAIGSSVDCMSAQNHDEILAATSHLPHLLAFSLVDALVSLEQNNAVFRYAAGGFSDFTRIAESDPTMWKDIFMTNRDALLKQLDHFQQHIDALRFEIQHEDSSAIMTRLTRAQTARKQFLNQSQ